jgi:hypothetical protein
MREPHPSGPHLQDLAERLQRIEDKLDAQGKASRT